MKRSVAILGPTPSFVRWAIEQPCPLRDIDVENLPDQSFRQLRNLREFSIGLIEKRLFEGFCVHVGSASSNVEDCRAFSGNEVLDAHGGAEAVDSQCRECPANALDNSRSGVWAGCYGWLPALGGFSFDKLINADSNLLTEHELENRDEDCHIDLVEAFEATIGKHKLVDPLRNLFHVTTPWWYGIWQAGKLNREQAIGLSIVVGATLEDLKSNGAAAGTKLNECVANLVQFHDALNCCVDHRLTLHVELMPPGHSDGRTWTIFSHCPNCKIEMTEKPEQQRCSACGKFGNPHGQRKSKVLGLRPYVQLVGVMGKEKTAQFMSRFESRDDVD